MNDNRTTVIIERVFSKRGKTLEEIYIVSPQQPTTTEI